MSVIKQEGEKAGQSKLFQVPGNDSRYLCNFVYPNIVYLFI